MVYQGRVSATFAKGIHALHGSAGPLKESGKLWTSISGLHSSESAGCTQTFFEEPEGAQQPQGEKRMEILKWLNYLNGRDN